ncbi:MAG: hypothetical protein EOP06_04305 [Proteobacteria bacterium]|nr:MAG: hypothetical protein EOP06_04305 [Pseudomonadota bacterium]
MNSSELNALEFAKTLRSFVCRNGQGIDESSLSNALKKFSDQSELTWKQESWAQAMQVAIDSGLEVNASLSSARSLIKTIGRHLDLSIDGTVYEADSKFNFGAIESNFRMLYNKDFLERYSKAFFSKEFSEIFKEDEFEERNFSGEISLTEVYEIVFTDESRYSVQFPVDNHGAYHHNPHDFHGDEDSFAAAFAMFGEQIVWNSDDLSLMAVQEGAA